MKAREVHKRTAWEVANSCEDNDLRVPASCEVGTLYDTDGTTILEENHFNSWNSKLWSRVRSTFSVDLNNMYTTLR